MLRNDKNIFVPPSLGWKSSKEYLLSPPVKPFSTSNVIRSSNVPKRYSFPEKDEKENLLDKMDNFVNDSNISNTGQFYDPSQSLFDEPDNAEFALKSQSWKHSSKPQNSGYLSKFSHELHESNEFDCESTIPTSMQTPQKISIPSYQTPGGRVFDGTQLRSVEEIPERFRRIFKDIPYFNVVQSKVFDDAFFTDEPLVVCAPTGSGKTLIFELAIVRLLIEAGELGRSRKNFPKIVYMAPVKALCTERHNDWSVKFESVGLECMELTGDSDIEDFFQLQKADVILTTPEKWDSMTRRWRDNTSLVKRVELFLIDEVHLLNDETRGATMEAVVSRMKTVQTCISSGEKSSLRFIAVSATIPNTEDIAEWLGTPDHPAVHFNMNDDYRPVKLRKVVLGYPWSSNGSEFKFDINLNYKLGNVIQNYSDNKPTLVFCSTRKSVEQASTTLMKDLNFVHNASHKQNLIKCSNLVHNSRLREMLLGGIGYHHAGLDIHDRHLVEELFVSGQLLVLVSTSTLAMGVNLPAHLVIVKSTSHYVKGVFQEYSQSEILQMIGRAGRPQFDTSATAVIMTRQQSKDQYCDIVNGSQHIESSLHSHLIEHLNAEIVLMTIKDVTVALEWIRSTFLYIRILKNPTHYGYPAGISRKDADERLHELCMRNLNSLTSINLVGVDDDFNLVPTEAGKLMARYCIAYETLNKFSKLNGNESLEELLHILSDCHEFKEVNLRMNERTNLNKMNKDKNRVTIRFPMQGRIKTTAMKVNCLLQATFGCISIQDFTLTQDVTKIFRNASRVTKCLVEFLLLGEQSKCLYSAIILTKCVKARLWENSRYVTKQLPSIGATLSSVLANAGVCSFEKCQQMGPREIEMIVNRNPPFGNNLQEAVNGLPKYAVHVEQSKRYSKDSCDITIQVVLTNHESLSKQQSAGKRHPCILLIGDSDNKVLLKQRVFDSQLLTYDDHKWQRTLTVARGKKGDELSVKLISLEWVGLDVESVYTPYYVGPRLLTAMSGGVQLNKKESKYFEKLKPTCKHNCKKPCGHACCNKFKSKPNEGLVSNPIKRKKEVKQINQVVPSTPTCKSHTGWDQLDSFCQYQQTPVKQYSNNTVGLPIKQSSFEKEEQCYQDQINARSRMNCTSNDEEFWKELQCFDDDIVDITPRPSKYSKVQFSAPSANKDTSRMGKVVAWNKSSPVQQNNSFQTKTHRRQHNPSYNNEERNYNYSQSKNISTQELAFPENESQYPLLIHADCSNQLWEQEPNYDYKIPQTKRVTFANHTYQSQSTQSQHTGNYQKMRSTKTQLSQPNQLQLDSNQQKSQNNQQTLHLNQQQSNSNHQLHQQSQYNQQMLHSNQQKSQNNQQTSNSNKQQTQYNQQFQHYNQQSKYNTSQSTISQPQRNQESANNGAIVCDNDVICDFDLVNKEEEEDLMMLEAFAHLEQESGFAEERVNLNEKAAPVIQTNSRSHTEENQYQYKYEDKSCISNPIADVIEKSPIENPASYKVKSIHVNKKIKSRHPFFKSTFDLSQDAELLPNFDYWLSDSTSNVQRDSANQNEISFSPTIQTNTSTRPGVSKHISSSLKRLCNRQTVDIANDSIEKSLNDLPQELSTQKEEINDARKMFDSIFDELF